MSPGYQFKIRPKGQRSMKQGQEVQKHFKRSSGRREFALHRMATASIAEAVYMLSKSVNVTERGDRQAGITVRDLDTFIWPTASATAIFPALLVVSQD